MEYLGEHFVDKILIDSNQIQTRISELAKQINQDFSGQTVHLIGILRGCIPFFADLLKQIKIDVTIDFITMSSYEGEIQNTGDTKLIHSFGLPLEGKNIIIVEDIVDSGVTLLKLRELISKEKPKSICCCSLLSKPSRRIVEVPLEYCGFEIQDTFIIGYGLDYQQKLRNLPYIASFNLNVTNEELLQ